MRFTIKASFAVMLAHNGANINEIILAADGCLQDFSHKFVKLIIELLQEELVVALTGDTAPEKLRAHERKGFPGETCCAGPFILSGWRQKERTVRTELGYAQFRVRQVKCKGCGKKWAPILNVLALEERQRSSGTAHKIAIETISELTYRHSSACINRLKNVSIPKSTSHRWLKEMPPLEFRVEEGIDSLIVDGTGYKKQTDGLRGKKPAGGRDPCAPQPTSTAAERGNIKFAIGIDKKGKLIPLGTWAGKDWEVVKADLKNRLNGEKPMILVSDGEKGIDEALSELVEDVQRCSWHGVGQLYFPAWADGLRKRDIREKMKRMKALLAIELPKADFDEANPVDKERIKQRLDASREQLGELIGEMRQNGYEKAASYLERASGKLFSYVELWLKCGFLAPRTTSILEALIGRLAKRLKRVAWNWSDEGIEKIAMIMMRRATQPQDWEKYWKDRLGLKNRCVIVLRELRAA
jgi:hypothetical protein